MISTGVLFTDRYELTMAQLYFRMGLGRSAEPIRVLLSGLSGLWHASGRLRHHGRTGSSAWSG